MDEYFHDPIKRSLYKAPVDPRVSEKTDSKRNTIITVSAHIEGTCFGAQGSGDVSNVSYSAQDWFTSRDSPEQAVRYFKMGKYPTGRISASEYADLYEKYSKSVQFGLDK